MLSGWNNLTEDEKTLMLQGVLDGTPRSGPWHLEIHPTHQCNINCFFCINKCNPRHQAGATLPWEALQKFLAGRAAAGLKMLRLSGGGEPLLYPELRPLLSLMASRGIQLCELTTNGTQLKTFASELIAAGLQLAAVSINEATSRDYAQSMGVGEKMFERVVDGIGALREAGRALPPESRPVLRLQFFVHRGNWHNLHAIYRTGIALGADVIHLRTIMELPPESRIPAAAYPELQSLLTSLIEENCRPGQPALELDLSRESGSLNRFAQAELERLRPPQSEPPRFNEPNPRGYYCLMPWYGAVIAVDGSVYPCCMMMQRPLGNVLSDAWDSIWRGAAFSEMRRELRELMLLHGELEYSRRFHPFLQPACIGCFGCQWSFRLCSPEFYETLGVRLKSELPRLERFGARMKNNAICLAHCLRGR